ncbi:isotrichodermin C-15 hydroxylase [Verticillium alfalfae VaMs.102]|uniref:Isotrichodermin C-15 hydroxylase n=1 Tax=Verticillium alfalfae (strain VaMs.102 / ATCC MYA-4576 / FGSC 10136) TaxID=526221 RepID=C9SNP6_VERA1|nr:isotrichodermin C-15 hydroxylase [Verticillium alfalfae VaMs.102]EEY20411.1 isotrichodermin C-15 hydroxylase [Verticillium alfalfae VaMs.102]
MTLRACGLPCARHLNGGWLASPQLSLDAIAQQWASGLLQSHLFIIMGLHVQDIASAIAAASYWKLAGAVLGLLVIYQALSTTYNVFFHPLRHYPGPFLQGASKIPWFLHQTGGTLAFHTQGLHEKYGPVVRIAPHHLSFTDPQAFKDIYGHRIGAASDMPELPKATMFYHVSRRIPHNIISSTIEDHRGLRRSLAHGFSDKAMREQEPIIGRYVDLLMLRLHGLCGAAAEGTAAVVDLKNYYNWTTFDAIGDLVFGESFGCLEANKQHPWVDAILSAVHQGAFLIGLIYLGFGELVELSRLAAKPGRADLFEGVLRKRDELGLTFAHLAGNASLLVVAGSETTATLLSGATYLLVSNRHVLDKVTKEVRETFASAVDINLSSVGGLSYMLAVLNESFRCYPPVTSNLVRRVPLGGQTIAGNYVPVGTLVEVQQWSANHSTDNWADPWTFRPERFLDSEEEAAAKGNKFEALQPFSVGPRNCIGRK